MLFTASWVLKEGASSKKLWYSTHSPPVAEQADGWFALDQCFR